jgi:drug/metabolite transporter (DMT)-like permease
MPARLGADLGLLLVTAIWGATFVMVKEALAGAGPLTFVALRFSLAAAVILPLLQLRPQPPSWRLARAGALIGFFLFAGYALQTAGLQFTSASKAGFITGLSVVIVPLLEALNLRRPPTRSTLAGVVLATLGLALLTLGGDLAVELGDLLVLGCALAFALHILSVDRYAGHHDPLALTSAQIVPAALLTSLGALAFEQPTAAQLLAVLPAALFTGLFATVAAFYLQTLAQRFTTPTHTALIFTMEPVFAGLFAYLVAGEQLGPAALTGCGLILVGMLVAQLGDRFDPPLATISCPNSGAGCTRARRESGRSRRSGCSGRGAGRRWWRGLRWPARPGSDRPSARS